MDTSNSPGIILPLAVFSTIGLLCVLIFCLVRPIFKDIYLPRIFISSQKPPHLSQGFISWIPTLFHYDDSELEQFIGLDSITFLRFLWMGAKLFTWLSLIGLTLLTPVNYYSQIPSFSNSTGFLYEDVLLPAFSVDNVPNQSPYLWVHLLFTWIFSISAYSYIIAFYRKTVSSKLKSERNILKETKMNRIDLRTIMVFGIPRDIRKEIELAAFFESLDIGRVQNTVICRKWSNLRHAVQMRSHYLGLLEIVYAKIIRKFGKQHVTSLRNENISELSDLFYSYDVDTDSSRVLGEDHIGISQGSERILTELISRVSPRARLTHKTGFLGLIGKKVDSLEYYLLQFKEWNRNVEMLRKNPENSPSTSVGFVTFESPVSASIASQIELHKQPFACMARMAPEPRDLYWFNLSSAGADSHIKLFRSIAVIGSLLFLVFSSTAIVSTFAGLIDLQKLSLYIPGLKDLLKGLPITWIQVIQGVIPTILVAAWTSSLPAVLLILSRMQGIETESWIEMSLMSKYFFYQLWNVLFVQVFVRAVLYEIILNPRQFIEVLGSMLPKASTVLINYVLLQAVAVYPAQLLLVGPLVLTWFTRLAPWSYSSPRQRSDAYYPSILTCINYGISYPIPLLVFVLGITYAPIAPLILPFSALFFIIAFFVYKYMFLYVHLPRYENRGKIVPLIANRCLFGVVLMQLTMMGLLALKSIGKNTMIYSKAPGWGGYAQMVLGVGPLLIISFGVYWWLRQGYERQINQLPFEIIAKVSKELSRNNEVMDSNRPVHDSVVFDGQELESVVHLPISRRESNVNLNEESYNWRTNYGSPEAGEEDSLLSRENTLNIESFDNSIMAYHIEPPMTRVDGILDAPISFDGFKEENDLQNSTYLHPALIGRLPIAWIPGNPQPESLEIIRKQQEQNQIVAFKKFLSRQRVGVIAMEDIDNSPEREHRHGIGGNILTFVDQLTAWALLTLS